jgi:L-fucose mutarotase
LELLKTQKLTQELIRMLKGIDPILSPELLMHLCAMGHGEWVAVVDANFTAQHLAQGKPLVRLPGLSLLRVSQAILSVFPLGDDLSHPAAYMHASNQPDSYRTAAQQSLVDHLVAGRLAADRVKPIERFAFYDQVRNASLIVQTGEASAYGNALFAKGVILNE